MLKLYNSRTKQKEVFEPINKQEVGMYTCGPTVYHYVHIGNLRTFVFEDVLRRVLRWNGYKVKHVMNITDVGHLTDDADAGEDKMEKGSAREGKTAWEIAEFYTEAFMNDIADLNILEPHVIPKATEHIDEQVAMVETLTEKGHSYQTDDGIYFDTTSINDYGAMIDIDKQDLQAGARVAMGQKKNPHDFALWKFSKEGEQRQMEWDAFMRKGFPGWHIECSAMSSKYLGDRFDIHCGGIDLKPVHHINEIAQSEAASGQKPWVNYWLHGEFINLESGDKMSKSSGNFVTLSTIKEKGIDPLAYRFYLLQAHYRKQLAFSWEALEAAAQGLENLRRQVATLPEHTELDTHVRKLFEDAINDDMNMPEALAILFKALKEKSINKTDVAAFDKVLGLHLLRHKEQRDIPHAVQSLLAQRNEARAQENWAESDRLRDEIAAAGFIVKDSANGQVLE